jgi:hypothetical protein
MTFEQWFKKESGLNESTINGALGDLTATAWKAAIREAKDLLADRGSQHFDHEKEAYVDSHELLDAIDIFWETDVEQENSRKSKDTKGMESRDKAFDISKTIVEQSDVRYAYVGGISDGLKLNVDQKNTKGFIQEVGEQDNYFSQDEDPAQDAKLRWITSYIVGEKFPMKHIEAICTIVSKFNESEESEKEIFEFVEKLKGKYK